MRLKAKELLQLHSFILAPSPTQLGLSGEKMERFSGRLYAENVCTFTAHRRAEMSQQSNE